VHVLREHLHEGHRRLSLTRVSIRAGNVSDLFDGQIVVTSGRDHKLRRSRSVTIPIRRAITTRANSRDTLVGHPRGGVPRRRSLRCDRDREARSRSDSTDWKRASGRSARSRIAARMEDRPHQAIEIRAAGTRTRRPRTRSPRAPGSRGCPGARSPWPIGDLVSK
jgi:hypothetical protein